MQSIGIPANGVLRLLEVIEVGDFDDDDRRDAEGFGGTALLQRIGTIPFQTGHTDLGMELISRCSLSACPDCTFENDSKAAHCEMCSRPFGFQ